MSTSLLIVQTLNGLQFGVLLFLIAAGLTLVFGVMDFINLAHGADHAGHCELQPPDFRQWKRPHFERSANSDAVPKTFVRNRAGSRYLKSPNLPNR